MLPVQVTFRDILASSSIESHIRKRAEKLNRFHDRISSCRVVVNSPQRHKHQGKLYNIRIDVTVPGKELVVTHKNDQDVYVAIRDAFNAISRRLEEHSHKRHGHVKTHNEVRHGHVTRLIRDEGYGFIEGVDGNEYYFSVTNVGYPAFSQLLVGDAVEFTSVVMNDGRQAQHVIKERHSHPVAA